MEVCSTAPSSWGGFCMDASQSAPGGRPVRQGDLFRMALLLTGTLHALFLEEGPAGQG